MQNVALLLVYRKSPSPLNPVSAVPDVSSMNLDDYNIHVIASVLKQWLRDLPSPLMTFELYEEFLRAMGKASTWPLLFLTDVHLLY